MSRADNPYAHSKPENNLLFTEKSSQKHMTEDCQFNWQILVVTALWIP